MTTLALPKLVTEIQWQKSYDQEALAEKIAKNLKSATAKACLKFLKKYYSTTMFVYEYAEYQKINRNKNVEIKTKIIESNGCKALDDATLPRVLNI